MRFFNIIFFIAFALGNAQEFIPVDTVSYAKSKALKTTYGERFNAYNKSLSQTYSGKLKKEILKLVEERQEEILQIFEENDLLYNTAFNAFLQASLDTIVQNNNLEDNYTFLLSKSPSPNAFSVGYNTIVVNMGLFKYLENEYQLRSVLMHELAHDLENHAMNSIVNLAKDNVSNSLKKSLQDINETRYNRGGLAFKRIKELLISRSEKNQKEELEADSLGFALYANTPWPKQAFANAFMRLKLFEDAPSYALDTTLYRRLFDLEQQPFKPKWLAKEDFSAYNYNNFKDKIDADSIASHPVLSLRIEKIKSFMPTHQDTTVVAPSQRFSDLQQTAVFQQVANLFDLKEYGASLYSCLILLENYPEHTYLLKYLGLNFNEIYKAQKTYTLNRYVEKLKPNEQSQSYGLFLNFIWNLRLSEMKAIADHYIQAYP